MMAPAWLRSRMSASDHGQHRGQMIALGLEALLYWPSPEVEMRYVQWAPEN